MKRNQDKISLWKRKMCWARKDDLIPLWKLLTPEQLEMYREAHFQRMYGYASTNGG